MDRIVIGVGNRDRGDDGAGVAVAELITGVTTHTVRAGAMDLYELWTDSDTVVVVDAMRSGAPPGTIRSFDVSTTPLPGETFSSTHSFGPAAGIEIARALGRLPAAIEVIGIEAGDLAIGGELSAEVASAVQSLSEELSHA